MAKAAEKRWTIEEFLDWDDGTDRRHELVDGLPADRDLRPTQSPSRLPNKADRITS